MSSLTREQQRQLIGIWKTAGPAIARIRRDALRGMPFAPDDVREMLSLAEKYDGPPRFAEGMVEMQRLFMKHPDHPCNKQRRAEAPADERG